MNTKIILSLGASMLLASSLLAMNPQNGGAGKCGMKSQNSQKMMKNSKQSKKSRHHDRFVAMMMRLNLSDAQRVEVKEIFKTSMKKRVNPASAFSDTAFNKDEFVRIEKQKRENAIENRAELIANIYGVLTSEQKKEFKAMLDRRAQMKKHKKMKK